uniref:Uncharacterized protein n=1 Tax=Romanomermis culicivorax TaxID=13658 RepID=A0A915IZ09_ROMCU
MTNQSEATTSQSSGITSSLINPLPIFPKVFNVQDQYISYQGKQHHQDDRFFFADEYNIKRMIRIAEFEHWFETLGFPTGHRIMFDALAATSDDWTTSYEFLSALKTIVISFDQADDWKCLKDMHG